jgi:hypothetical protein
MWSLILTGLWQPEQNWNKDSLYSVVAYLLLNIINFEASASIFDTTYLPFIITTS